MIFQILVFILITALGVSLGLWFAHNIQVNVSGGACGPGGYGPPPASFPQGA